MPRDSQAETMDEGALLLAYAAGDRAAAATLTRRMVPRLLRLATRLLGDLAEAEDVVQETMLRLWRLAPDWDPSRAQPGTWAYRVATNLCTDRLRRRGRSSALDEVFVEAGEPPDETPAVEAKLQSSARADALRAAIADLPERQAQAVTLRHIEGLSNPEIADVMGIGIDAVESLTARGKRSLKARLLGQREELGLEDDTTG